MTFSAADIMTRSVVKARPTDTVGAIAKMLSDHSMSTVLVCDEDGFVFGIVSEGDLMRPFGQANSLRRAWWVDLLAEGTDLASAFLDYISSTNAVRKT